MSSAQEQIVHTIIEGFKEQRIDALDWLRHKILGALINEANAGEATCRQMILDAVDLKDGAISARDAEIARLRDGFALHSEGGSRASCTGCNRVSFPNNEETVGEESEKQCIINTLKWTWWGR